MAEFRIEHRPRTRLRSGATGRLAPPAPCIAKATCSMIGCGVRAGASSPIEFVCVRPGRPVSAGWCGTLTVAGRDVGPVLISAGLARSYVSCIDLKRSQPMSDPSPAPPEGAGPSRKCARLE
jgi:hypothetical protein